MGKKDVATITQSAGLAARALARLEAEASAIHEAERERRLQLVSSPGSEPVSHVSHSSAVVKSAGMALEWIGRTTSNASPSDCRSIRERTLPERDNAIPPVG